MNDEINRLFEEKANWEAKIKKLGGADYKKYEPKTLDADGYEVPNAGGYRYFGAAKNLPGVAELFKNKPKQIAKKSYIDMYKGINLDYYGMDDFDDNDDDDEKKEYNDEIAKEEKTAESLLYLDYLDKLNNRENLNIFDNKNKINEKEEIDE